MESGLRKKEISDIPQFFSGLLYRHLGYVFPADKSYLLESRLAPVMEAHSIHTIEHLAENLSSSRSTILLAEVLDAMSIGETSFFRDSTSFQDLKTKIIPHFEKRNAQQKRLRIWSAACSSGQEPYSLAMMLQDTPLVREGWNIHIHATDACASALVRAKHATYSPFELQRGLPETLRTRWFRQLDEERWQLAREIRSLVECHHHNLLEPLEAGEPFDLILCRNVLIYFDNAMKQRVLKNVISHLSPGGMLMIARTESIAGLNLPLDPVPGLTNVFTRK